MLNVSSGTTEIDGRHYLYVNVNEASTFTLVGSDNGDLSYQFSNTSAKANISEPDQDESVAVRLVVDDINPVHVRYVLPLQTLRYVET